MLFTQSHSSDKNTGLPYYVHKLQIPAASRSLPCGPCAPFAGSEGNEGYAVLRWQKCYPGYRLKPQQLRRWVRWCLGNQRVKIKGHKLGNISNRNCGWLTYFLNTATCPSITFKTTIDSLQTVCYLFYLFRSSSVMLSTPLKYLLFLLLYFPADCLPPCRSNTRRRRESHYSLNRCVSVSFDTSYIDTDKKNLKTAFIFMGK